MPWDPTKSNRVTLPDGTVKVYPAGTPIEIAIADAQRGTQGRGTGPGPGPGANAQAQLNDPEMGDWGDIAADVGMAVAGMGPAGGVVSRLARTLGPALISGANEMRKGNDPIEMMTKNGLISGGAEALSWGLPRAATPFALGMAGVPKAMGRKDIAGTFIRENEQRKMPLLVGRAKPGNKVTETLFPSSTNVRKEAGARGAEANQAANASGHKFPLKDLKAPEDSRRVLEPIDRLGVTEEFNNSIQSQQTIQEQLRKQFPDASADELTEMWEKGTPDVFKSIGARPTAQYGIMTAAEKRQAKAYDAIKEKTLKDWQQSLIDKTDFNVSDMAELQKSESAKLDGLYDKRGRGEYISPSEDIKGQLSERLVKTSRDWRHGPADIQGNPQTTLDKLRNKRPRPGQDDAIKSADKATASAILMDDINQGMVGLGPLARGGVTATRGALMRGPGEAIGAPPWVASAMGPLLSPQFLSGIGFWGGKAARLAPVASHGWDAKEKIQKKTKRRDPK
jgi:hypothetical protein